MQNPTRFIRILVVVIGLIAAACSSDGTETAVQSETTIQPLTPAPETTYSVAPEPESVASSTEPDGSAIEFEPCGDGAECALVDVPLDYSAPHGETVEIHVIRNLANGDRMGTLFMNPGGPGFSPEGMIRGIGQFGPPPLVDMFDLVGIDPRGTGKSGGIDCNENWKDDTEARVTPGDGFADDVDAFAADFTEMARVCEETYGVEFLASLTTENAARDMETIRVALGDEPLNYLGYSYGTAIGSVYATLFPDSIRTMILDGAVPTNPAESSVEAQAAEIEGALIRLDKSCELWAECPVADGGFLQALGDVRAILEENGSIGPLEHDTLDRAFIAMVGIPFLVRDIAPGLADALAGDGSMLAQMGADFRTPLPDGDGFVEYSGAGAAIICADGFNLRSGTVPELLPQVERTYATSPNVNPPFWEVPCDLWPVTGPGIPAVDYTGSASILVVGNSYDPITPLAWSQALAEDLGPNATLLTWDGSDHTVALNGASQCIDDHVFAYLIDEVVPAPGTLCESRGFVGIQYDGSPVVIDGVTPGGSADAAGVKVGDLILEADGKPVETDADVPFGAIQEPLDLLIQRGDEEIELSIIRGAPVWELWRTAE